MTISNKFTLHHLGSDSADFVVWDEFVNKCSKGTFFHLSGWKKVIENEFGHIGHYLYVTLNDNIVGVLPLVEQKSFLFGHTLISTPFCVYGGVASDTEEVMFYLEEKAIELAKTLSVDYLELRYPFERNNPELIQKCAHSNFACSLGENEEDILVNVKKKQRAVIRKSLKNELVYRVDRDTISAYQIYSQSVRNLGTPVFPKSYFDSLQKQFDSQCNVLTVEHNSTPVSSVLSFYYKNEVIPYYGGGVEQARSLKSNDFMYYKLMCEARVSKQCTSFDFGRSKDDSGAYNYKHTWGMEPKPLHYQYFLVKSDSLPNLSPNNPKYKFFIKMWTKLPIAVSQFLGPFLSKYLG